jgi:hypothetical protein
MRKTFDYLNEKNIKPAYLLGALKDSKLSFRMMVENARYLE